MPSEWPLWSWKHPYWHDPSYVPTDAEREWVDSLPPEIPMAKKHSEKRPHKEEKKSGKRKGC